jgi:hypothetical protein
MTKTVLLAATATLSAGLIGLAAAASAGGPSSSGPAEVSPAAVTTTATHDVGDDHGSAGQGADDALPLPTPTTVDVPVVAPAPAAAPAVTPSAGRDGADDPVGHDVGDDHGVDDPATHDVGDDHGRHGGHGADD